MRQLWKSPTETKGFCSFNSRFLSFLCGIDSASEVRYQRCGKVLDTGHFLSSPVARCGPQAQLLDSGTRGWEDSSSDPWLCSTPGARLRIPAAQGPQGLRARGAALLRGGGPWGSSHLQGKQKDEAAAKVGAEPAGIRQGRGEIGWRAEGFKVSWPLRVWCFPSYTYSASALPGTARGAWTAV